MKTPRTTAPKGTPSQRRKFLAAQRPVTPIPVVQAAVDESWGREPQPKTPFVVNVGVNPKDAHFIQAIVNELSRARGKFPSSIHCFAALVEEVGELGKAFISEGEAEIHDEAVQTAVMAIRCGVEGDKSFAVYRDMKGL